ncbi:unnamed protein product [Schistosoma curassoni]|uniref:ELMO domain-containing protein n=1 Tax=Schistosoma curassoni TaxID=6186 RepID=A0A183KY68_9TREM|nr:unnamed protein product [Schistosoma curassoni]
MKQLCSVVYFDKYTINPTEQCIEEACIKLGFKIPTDPYADFEKPPGTLGFQCIYNYTMKNRNKVIDMLNYAYPCQKNSYLTNNTTNNNCKLYHLSELNILSSLNVNNNNNNNVNEISSKSSQQRVQRHFSTVDSNSIQNILHTTHLHDDSIQNQRNNFIGRRFTLDSLIATSNLSQSFKPMKEYYSHNSFSCNYSISSSSSTISSLIDKKPLFPIIEAANAVTSMLCELLTTNDTSHEPNIIIEQDDKDFYLSSPLYPILLNKSNNNTNHYQSNLSSFEDIFDCVFSKFFSSWTQMKAVPEDLIAVGFHLFTVGFSPFLCVFLSFIDLKQLKGYSVFLSVYDIQRSFCIQK